MLRWKLGRLNFCMICLLTNHINSALQRVTNVIKPMPICQRIKSIAKHFTFGRQEDSHEFLRYVIDHLWRSCLAIHEQELGITGTSAKLDHLTKSTTAINHIFGGYHRSQVLCLNCKEKSNTYDYFMDFMLEIQVHWNISRSNFWSWANNFCFFRMSLACKKHCKNLLRPKPYVMIMHTSVQSAKNQLAPKSSLPSTERLMLLHFNSSVLTALEFLAKFPSL